MAKRTRPLKLLLSTAQLAIICTLAQGAVAGAAQRMVRRSYSTRRTLPGYPAHQSLIAPPSETVRLLRGQQMEFGAQARNSPPLFLEKIRFSIALVVSTRRTMG